MDIVKIIIFNVEQGFCSFVRCPNGHTLLIDCGKTETFSPIKYILDNELSGTVSHDGFELTKFILSHPHDDHLEDIARLKSNFPPAIMNRESSYNWDSLKVDDKEEYENLDTYSKWQYTYNRPITNQPDYGLEIIDEFNLSPKEAYEIHKEHYVNNASIPVILNFNGTKYNEKILFGGDLMKEGWLELLKNQDFKNNLKNVDFFITSHHGHTSGYCKEVFDAMGSFPFLNIVSTHSRDESVDSIYSSTSKGINLNGEKRHMLSTRKDGNVIINISSEGNFSISTRYFNENIRKFIVV